MKRKIAVLGGGMSSLTAVWALTSVPGWQSDYQVTVYQQGWRLGGKCASSRNLERGGRIEEHGLHLLFGWYENVFKILREAYAQLGGGPNAWEGSFLKFTGAITMQEKVAGAWSPWPIECPHDADAPGDGSPVDISPWTLSRKAIEWALAQQAGSQRTGDFFQLTSVHRASAYARLLPPDPRLVSRSQLEELRDRVDQAQRDLQAGGGPAFLDGTTLDAGTALIEGPSLVDPGRRERILISMILAMGRGLVVGLLLERTNDWFTLDDRDLRDWLRANGASEEAIGSAPVSALYDAAFSAYSTLGAGTIVQALLRAAFTWRGSAVWRMNGGMGDVVFSPLYRVLKTRGVRFEFFHRVEGLELSSDHRRVERVRIDQQARAKEGDYAPLTSVSGITEVWPSAPLVEQLDVDPKELAKHDLEGWWDTWRGRPLTLTRGRDFDDVVLGISIGALGSLCEQLVNDPANPRFGEMVRGVLTTQTRAAQLWIGTDKLGWSGACTIPFEEPYDTVCQMNHLIPLEPGSLPGGVKTIAYLCSPLNDDEPPAPRTDLDYPARQYARAKSEAQSWLEDCAPTIWPGAASAAGFDWSVLVDPTGQQGAGRLDAQYINTPTNLSDRYVLMAQASNRFRLRADESGYENLYLAGDWTKTALSGGFLESAAMGGIQAARAIEPRVPKAIGDWLPDRPAGPRAPPPPAPPFLLRDGDLLAKPPLDLDLFVCVFLLEADMGALQHLLDQHLNWGRAKYRPAGPFVALYLSTLQINAHPFAKIPAKDFGIWIPAWAGTEVGGVFIPSRIVTYTPYLWADGGWAMIGGREVFGFPKQLGNVMTMPADPADAGTFLLRTMVLQTVQSTARVADLFSVQRKDAPALGLLTPHFESLAELRMAGARWLDRQLAGASSAHWAAIAGALDSIKSMPMVFLKEFPDQTAGAGACYRAVVEAPIDLLDPHVEAGFLPGTYELTLQRYVSHNIAATLGLSGLHPGAGADCLRPIGQFWMKALARLQPGAVLENATSSALGPNAMEDWGERLAAGVAHLGGSVWSAATGRLAGLARRFGFTAK